MKLTVAKAPCKSCPYRKDVPSGVWSAHEYNKLPLYDGEMWQQMMKGATARFDCHQQDGNLCAGWLGCHGPDKLLAIRMIAIGMHGTAQLDEAVFDFVSPVPLFKSGAEAAAHGKRAIRRPGLRARNMVDQLTRKQERETK